MIWRADRRSLIFMARGGRLRHPQPLLLQTPVISTLNLGPVHQTNTPYRIQYSTLKYKHLFTLLNTYTYCTPISILVERTSHNLQSEHLSSSHSFPADSVSSGSSCKSPDWREGWSPCFLSSQTREGNSAEVCWALDQPQSYWQLD